ncbi:hypothetical protein Q1695_009630 [Nippostrongylus brasiliensis]|nr:hypothetical protein Q1695_009630 [Nippostrongylus brasiliensis]
MIDIRILVIVLLTSRTVTASVSLPITEDEAQCLDDIGVMGIDYFPFFVCVTLAGHNQTRCNECRRVYLSPNIRQCIVKKALDYLKAYC